MIRKRIISILLAFVFFCSVITSGAGSEELSVEQAALIIIDAVQEKDIYDFDELRFKSVGNIPTCRSEFRFSLCLLSSENKGHQELGNMILRKYLSSQVKDPESPYYGAWYYPELLDSMSGLEWDMFVPITIFQIYFELACRLEPETKELLLESLQTCSKGLIRTWFSDYQSTLTHTNYHLLFVCDLLLSSEISNNPVGQFFAKVAFDVFIKYSLSNGIYEFNSPTYQAVDLQALYLIEKYSSDSDMKTLAKNWVDLILLDLLIHYNPSTKSLSGANSRSYNVFSGSGGTIKELVRLTNGYMSKDLISDVGDITPFYYDHELPSWLSEFVDNLPESFLFESRWGFDPWQVRQTFFDGDFSIGTSGRSYGSQDRNVVIDFPSEDANSSQFVPVISVNKKPWLLPSLGGGSGHNHLRIPVYTNHDGKRLIQLSHILFSGDTSKDVNRIAQTFIIPKHLEIKTHENSFSVSDGETSVFVKPFFISDQMVPKIHIEKNLPFPGNIIDFELMSFDPRQIKVDDVFCGFALEVFSGVDKKSDIANWSGRIEFETKKTESNLFCRFDGLEINYNIKDRYPENTPANLSFDVMKMPGVCVGDGFLEVGGAKLPFSLEALKKIDQ